MSAYRHHSYSSSAQSLAERYGAAGGLGHSMCPWSKMIPWVTLVKDDETKLKLHSGKPPASKFAAGKPEPVMVKLFG